jgi:hypothetical protein
METIVKELQAEEIKRRGVCISKDIHHLFPGIREKLTLTDELKSISEVTAGSQYRIRMPSWYEEHNGV